jgi:hypothetical protein
LKSNHLTGTLLADFGSLPALSWFDVSQNYILGTIPESFASAPSLADFRVAGNMLYGEIPHGLCSNTVLNSGATLQHGCSGLLCPAGTFSEFGYGKDDVMCLPCPDDQTNLYLGSLECITLTEADILSMLYEVMDGPEWPPSERENWVDYSLSVCDWQGIECDRNGKTTSISYPRIATIDS